VNVQPEAGLQASLVHGLPSLQTIGVVTHAPDRHSAVAVQLLAQEPDAAGSSSMAPSQSSSMPLQRSPKAGDTALFASLQSVGPQLAPSGEKPSPSSSVQSGEARSPKRRSRGVGQLKHRPMDAIVAPVAGFRVSRLSVSRAEAKSVPPPW
jgi:hypothetical protein